MDMDTDKENFKRKPLIKKVLYSETYQRPDRSYFQEPPELDSIINTGGLVQKILPKQTDIDKILKIIQRKVLKGTHFCVTVKEI